ncbi:hypothetical protein Tco_1122005 [Tanacetum coccineum]|uniref:Uncharacterized protein n=1 Tax=Tanacetum coccineum TaxID=301880 RepID=A0ABQ5J0P8_9ASTR
MVLITMKAVLAMSIQQLIDPVISEPPSKRQRVDRDTSQPSGVPAASTQHADDPDSAGGGSFQTCWFGYSRLQWILLVHTVQVEFSPFADFCDSSSPVTCLYDHIQLMFCLNPHQDAEILFRGQYISGAGVVVVDKLSDVDFEELLLVLRVRVMIDMENRRRMYFTYLKQLLPYVYREDLSSLAKTECIDFAHSDEWVVSSWKLYPKSSVHVLDLTNGKTVYMFVDKVYPIRATLLERMLRHRLTVPPSYCRDVVVAGNVIQTVQAGLRESYECLASVPIACTGTLNGYLPHHATARERVWLNIETAFGVVLKSSCWCQVTKNLDGIHFPYSCWDEKWLVQEQTALDGCCLFFNVVLACCLAGYLGYALGNMVSVLLNPLAGGIDYLETYSSSIPADNVPAGSSSSVPADYVL